MTFKYSRRGRPSAEDRERKALYEAEQKNKKPVVTDAMAIADLTESFDVLELLTRGAVAGIIRAVTATGAAGIGKTYTVQRVLESSEGCRYNIVRASISPVNLFKLGYRYRHKGNVIVLDDSDDIFNKEEGLSLMKGMCDSTDERIISWLKEVNMTDEESGEAIPRQYTYNGSMMFISNLNWQSFIDSGHSKYAEHMKALQQRSQALDMRHYDRQTIAAWIAHVADKGRIFDKRNVNVSFRQPVLDFIRAYKDTIKDLSIRTLTKLCDLTTSNPEQWERIARVTMLR